MRTSQNKKWTKVIRDDKLLAFVAFVVLIIVSPLKAQRTKHPPTETITVRTNEATYLAFDVSPDSRSIVFDLLGQLWLIPATGGVARPITYAVRDVAEDSDPSFSPDGHRVLFRGERNGLTGLWLRNIESGSIRQLTQLSYPEGYEGNAAWSPDGRSIAFIRVIRPDSSKPRGRTAIMLMDVDKGAVSELSIKGIEEGNVRSPVWIRGGREIAFVVSTQRSHVGHVWTVSANGGQAIPLTDNTLQARSPTFSPDNRLMAYFAPDTAGRTQIWIKEIGTSKSPSRLTNNIDVTPTRIRWSAHGTALLYSADGRLWRIPTSGGPPTQITFSAKLSIARPLWQLRTARLPEPGQKEPARGFMGLALSPDGSRIATLALGKLWIIPIAGSPRAIVNVPFEATALAWSSNGEEVAWSAGVADHEDLFAANLSTAVVRRITALPGRESFPVYSPDGKYLAFVHVKDDDGVLRVIDAHAANVDDSAKTQSLGSIGLRWASTPQWSPASDGLLVTGEPTQGQPTLATFVTLSGQRQSLKRFPDAPIFLQWTPQHTIVFVRHDRLWEAPFDKSGLLSDPKPIGTDAALYASTSHDGSVLFVSEGGLRLRSSNGTQQTLGWPLSYVSPIAEVTLIRNVRIVDGTGAPPGGPRDILIEQGRIKQIAPAGTISTNAVRVLDAEGRTAIPGLMDLHAHTYRPDLLPGYPYFGVTTIRDQGSSMAPLVAYADNIASGTLPGPRVAYGGFQFYSDWSLDEEQGRGIEPESDPNHIKRAVDLAQAFGAQHIKTRTFRRWDINARMITEAHRRGMRATGHCSHLLPLVAAGMDAKEHIGLCEERGDAYMYDDLIQLFKAANINVVPTISYLELAVRLNRHHSALEEDVELAPFLPDRENFGWMFNLKQAELNDWVQLVQQSREGTLKLWRAGVTIGTGTDIWQIPTGVHMELEQLVAVGMSPLQAIHAGTGASAKILGAEKDLGTISVGKWADLVILDADPLVDIRNTRRIWRVMEYGRLIDRDAILKVMHPR